MARKRRPRRPGAHLQQPAVEAPHWRWRTLPVWLAFTGGFILAWYIFFLDSSGRAPGIIAVAVFYAALFGFSLGLSRVTSYLFVRWRMRRARERGAAPAPPGRPRKEPRSPA